MPENMTAVAQVAPSLEISAPDYMDLQSDVSLGFSKDDIDLDLGLSDVEYYHNEDVVLEDIVHTAELGDQTVANDYDDLMVDHDTTADERVEDHIADVGHQANSPSVAAPLGDDDLIDYSDDDDDPPKSVALSSPQRSVYSIKTATIAAATALPQSPLPENSTDQHDESHTEGAADFDLGEAKDKDADPQAANVTEPYESLEHEEGAEPGEGEDLTYVQEEEYAGGEEAAQSAAPVTEADEYADEHLTESPLLSRPVEVYFEGDAYWLFKDHDTEGDGYWLIDDITVGSSSLAELFQSCRITLGDRIAHEHELGLQFKHLHGLELYEDNTACVAVSLERLVDLYFTLNAQDGINEPEPFCIWFVSRPRFATLLTDIVKFTEQGSGYKALDAAIEAGETHFESGPKASVADEASSEEDNGVDSEENANNDYDAGLEPTHGDEISGQEENNTEHGEHVPVAYENGAEADLNAAGQGSPSHTAVERAATSSSPKAAVADRPADSTNESEHRSGSEPHDDLIDYSDDDGEDYGKVRSTAGSTPSTATVQGIGSLSQPGSAEESKVSPQARNDEVQQVAMGDDAMSEHQEDNGLDNEDSYPGHSAYEAQDFEDFYADGTVDDTAQPYADPDFAELKYEALDNQLSLDLENGNAFDATAGDSLAGATDLAGTDDYLDLDLNDDWATHESAIPEQREDALTLTLDSAARADEEDAVAEHSAVIVSTTTADPDFGSSVNFSDSSTQGQKRSIDDVGDIYGEASDVIDTKRPRV